MSTSADSKCEAIFVSCAPLPSPLSFPTRPLHSPPLLYKSSVFTLMDNSMVTSAGGEGPPKPGTPPSLPPRGGWRQEAKESTCRWRPSLNHLDTLGVPPTACLSKSRGNPRSCGCRPRKGRRSGFPPSATRPRCPPVASERPNPK